MPLSPNAKNFIEEFSRLPRPLQEALSSSFLGQVVSDALNLSQVKKERYDDLMEATSEILMLHLPPSKFEELLIFKYQFNETQARIINKVISEKIFAPLKALLKKEEDDLLLKTNPPLPPKPSQSFSKFQIPKLPQISFIPFQKPLQNIKEIIKKPAVNKEIQSPQKKNLENFKSEKKLKDLEKNKEFKKEISPSISLPAKEEKKEEISLKPPLINEPLSENNTTLEKIKEKPQERYSNISNLTSLPSSITKSEPQSEKLKISEIKIPEPLEIKIEPPLQHNLEVSPITPPQTTPDEKEKIKDALLKIMTSKKFEAHPLVEEMERIEKNPPLKESKLEEIKKEKAPAQISEASEVFTGEKGHFKKKEETLKQETPDIFKIKIKEEKKEKEIPLVKKPIPYKKYISEKEEKPFGET